MSSDAIQTDDAGLDVPFGTFEPQVIEFDGDIVNVYIQKPKPEWGDDAKEKVVIIVRDWDRSEPDNEVCPVGAEKASVRVSRLTVSTHRRSNLSGLVRSIKEKLGVEVRSAGNLFGLQGRWKIEDKGSGKYISNDVLSVLNKPSRVMPTGLLPYVPKERTKDEDGEAKADALRDEDTIAEDAIAYFLSHILGEGGTPKEIKRRATTDPKFRASFPLAFQQAVSGKLAEDLLTNGLILYQADTNTY